ncbi:MAG: hypothetical protein Q4F65_11275 [Propionibacteriaceae bacterium]|nr:hypothetical protein [Propionibacteriaceae bacterium]
MPGRLCPACSGTLRWIEMQSGRLCPVDPVPTPQTGTVAARLVGERYVAGYIVGPSRPLRTGFVLFDPHTRVCNMRRNQKHTPKLF